MSKTKSPRCAPDGAVSTPFDALSEGTLTNASSNISASSGLSKKNIAPLSLDWFKRKSKLPSYIEVFCKMSLKPAQ
jgi:hypothetical protein